MSLSEVYYFAKNADSATQSKGVGFPKNSFESETCTGEVNQRTAKMMPCGLKRVQSDFKVWAGVKLIAAITCQKILGFNKPAMTFLFAGIFVTALNATKSLNLEQKRKFAMLLFDTLKFFEFSFCKENFKDTVQPAFLAYGKMLTFPRRTI